MTYCENNQHKGEEIKLDLIIHTIDIKLQKENDLQKATEQDKE